MVPADPKKYPIQRNGYALSELQVCQSAAGYYIGRMSWDEEFGFEEPGSRESDYMSREEAEAALKPGGVFFVREAFENEAAYDSGELPDIRQDWDSSEI